MATSRASWLRRGVLAGTASLVLITVGWMLLRASVSPAGESRIYDGRHADLVISRSPDGSKFWMRSDLPSQCDCPYHRMLRAEDPVTISNLEFRNFGGGWQGEPFRGGVLYRTHHIWPVYFIEIETFDEQTIAVTSNADETLRTLWRRLSASIRRSIQSLWR